MSDVGVVVASFDSPAVQGLLAEWNHELGFVPKGGSTVEPSDFTAPNGAFFTAVCSEAPVGCGGLRTLSGTTGEVKRLFVRPEARGRGTGRVLLAALEEHAVILGMEAVRLDTDGGESRALALFRSAGYQPIADYNRNPYARHWFEKRPPMRSVDC
ncbi:GNAT family N-acetyltransferase [Actinopolymorpha pittospori]|uniref:GNAT superfamily N-acetyltransferase n=1 Tax=Actinopolymorpha pittospori TaxID=648752 RepID=A0A927RKV6_9ACTN|nr:GNAT family N-acetyltransferase [Actinopolymorpha pittospori]MBE1608611.1 GNAT superfamily N-acetyltransferase [Actinopolymorpha pittospori]